MKTSLTWERKQTARCRKQRESVPNKMNPKKSTPRNVIIKIAKIKDKERILKAARKNNKLCTRKLPYS